MKYETINYDLKEICNLIQEFIDESVFKVKVDVKKIENIINSNCLKIVVYDDKKAIGIIMGYLYDHPLFNVKVSDDFLLYVKKEHRNGFIASKLIKMYECWAKENGANYIFINQSTGVGNVEKVKCLYEKMGFNLMGFNCMKEN